MRDARSESCFGSAKSEIEEIAALFRDFNDIAEH